MKKSELKAIIKEVITEDSAKINELVGDRQGKSPAGSWNPLYQRFDNPIPGTTVEMATSKLRKALDDWFFAMGDEYLISVDELGFGEDLYVAYDKQTKLFVKSIKSEFSKLWKFHKVPKVGKK